MSPPKTTADRQAIYSLLCGEENDVTLVYPKNGDYRSAIISRDLDGDGVSGGGRLLRGGRYGRHTAPVHGGG